MRTGALAAAILAATPLASAQPADAPGPLKLERIVLVERHGVRSPTQAPEALSAYSSQAWPQWPVAPGELTEHGARGVRLMGAWLRQDYARRGLWPATGCPGPAAAYVWADGKDQRTRLSGQALLDGAFPGCGLKARHGPDGETDAVFSPVDKGLCPLDAKAAEAAILSQAGGDLDRPGPGYDAAKAALRAVLTAPDSAPCAGEAGPCFLDGANRIRTTRAGQVALAGPLATASTVTESLYLEYAQGMAAGWGRADTDGAMAAIMPLHNLESDLARRTPYMAERNGALAMRAILAEIDGQAALPQQPAGRPLMVVLAGHDTQLSNLAGILGVDWTLKDQPDKTPPAAALVFEVWRDVHGERFVRLALVYQTLEDLRGETPLTAAHPARRIDLSAPGCADGPGGACPAERFEALISARLPAECVLPSSP